jgi:hypothetical protein
MLLEEIGERLVRQFLKRRHPVARELLELVERIVVEGDQFAHASSPAAATEAFEIANGLPKTIIGVCAVPNGISIQTMFAVICAVPGELRCAHLSSR